MAKTTKDIPALMPETNCLEDEGTLAFFKSLLGKNVSNVPAQIKRAGNFAESQDFIDSIGVEALKVAMEEFKVKCEYNNTDIPQTRDGADWFLDNFLSDSNIELWYSFGRKETNYFDDIDAYGTNLITRVLLDLTANHAIREGDATFLRGFHRSMILYMLNTKDKQV